MKRYKYSFAPDANAKGGVWAAAAGGLSLFFLLLTAVISFALEGRGGNWLGAVGLFSFLLSAYGFYMGIKSFQEKNVNHRYSVVGSLAGGVVMVLWLGTFLAGIVV